MAHLPAFREVMKEVIVLAPRKYDVRYLGIGPDRRCNIIFLNDQLYVLDKRSLMSLVSRLQRKAGPRLSLKTRLMRV